MPLLAREGRRLAHAAGLDWPGSPLHSPALHRAALRSNACADLAMGQADGEGAAASGLTLDGDTPSVLLDDGLDNGEAQTRPASVTGSRGVYPVKTLKDGGLLFGRNPNSTVTDGDDGLVVLTVNDSGDASSGLVVVNPVLDEIAEDTGQQQSIPADDDFSLALQL